MLWGHASTRNYDICDRLKKEIIYSRQTIPFFVRKCKDQANVSWNMFETRIRAILTSRLKETEPRFWFLQICLTLLVWQSGQYNPCVLRLSKRVDYGKYREECFFQWRPFAPDYSGLKVNMFWEASNNEKRLYLFWHFWSTDDIWWDPVIVYKAHSL